MLKRVLFGVLALCLLTGAAGCEKKAEKQPKIGVSFGVGPATRWAREKTYMEERAKELGATIEVRMNMIDEPKTQTQDCREMIDSGIDVLILVPRNINEIGEILVYAKQKDVKVISYARSVLGDKVDLFIGYDSSRMGQLQGQYLTEMVYKGDYILLRGDPGDLNATLLYNGAMRYINPIKDRIHIILDAAVPLWSPEEAKQMVMAAVAANGNKVDGILAPNDKIAGACVEALESLGVTGQVVITGMDAELDAVRRIVADKQHMTIFMDLKERARTAVNEAVHMAKGQPVTINAEFDNHSGNVIDANLITSKLVTKQNLDKILIENGYFTKEQVYGNP